MFSQTTLDKEWVALAGPGDWPPDTASSSQYEVHSEMSGSSGDVVQARDVAGGVHFYHTRYSSAVVPRQLPGDLRGFINRGKEIERLDRALAHEEGDPNSATILLVAGTAGVGKTSLAIHWAHRVREHFPDGQLYVDLRGYDPGEPTTPEYALDQFLRALNVPDRAIPIDVQAKAALYRSLAADWRMLMVLDNAATVGQVRPLLPGTAGCLAIVTSRSSLPGLVARDGAYRITIDVLLESEAIALLRSVTAEYRSNDSPEELAELTRLCVRLPLALRIAAERAAARPQMPLTDLIRDLRDESALWDALSSHGDGDGDTDGVRTVFAWSYRALSQDAARLFRLLGLHPGPEFSIAAAAATADSTIAKVRHLLDNLVEVHLLQQITPDRYRFHDLLHAYAVDQAHNDESLYNQHVTTQRILAWYLHTANAAAGALEYNPLPIPLEEPGDDIQPLRFHGHSDALHWCEIESRNIVDAVRTAARVRLDGIAWRMHAVLREFYAYRCQFGDWFTTGKLALDAVRRQQDRYGEAIILESLGKAFRQSGSLGEAEEYHRSALNIRRKLGERTGETRSLNALGLVGRQRGALDEAKSMFEQAIAIATELGNDHWLVVALSNLGETYVQCGEFDQAYEILQRALVMTRQQSNRYFQYECLQSLSRALRESRPAEAVTSIEQALSICRELEDVVLEGIALIEYGAAQLAANRPTDALVSYQRAATIHRQYSDQWHEGAALSGTGECYRRLGRFEEAISFHRRAVVELRDVDDRRGLAIALNRYADALSQAGDDEEATECRREARQNISEYADPWAVAFRARIDQRLTTAGTHDDTEVQDDL